MVKQRLLEPSEPSGRRTITGSSGKAIQVMPIWDLMRLHGAYAPVHECDAYHYRSDEAIAEGRKCDY